MLTVDAVNNTVTFTPNKLYTNNNILEEYSPIERESEQVVCEVSDNPPSTAYQGKGIFYTDAKTVSTCNNETIPNTGAVEHAWFSAKFEWKTVGN